MTDRRPSIDRRPRGSIAAVAGAIKASSPKGVRWSSSRSLRSTALKQCHTDGIVYDMKIVQARIDAATEAALARLRRQTGMTDSQLVRKGLELVSQGMKPPRARRVRGVGRFASRRSDLGSNKAHLSSFGRS